MRTKIIFPGDNARLAQFEFVRGMHMNDKAIN